MTLLSAAQTVASEVGFPQPTSIVSNTDATAIQLFTLLNRVGKEIAQRYEWSSLTKQTSFTTLAAETQTALPADFDHILNDTMYDRTTGWVIYGPYSARQWQRDKAFVSAGSFYTFRIRGKQVIFTPNPPAGDSVYYEYLSTYWVDSDADGLGDRALFTADTQTTVFEEDLLIKGGVVRFKQAKGLEYAEDMNRFEKHMELQFGRDGGRRSLNMSGRVPFVLGSGHTPETGFGS